MRTAQGFDWHGGDPSRPSTDWRTLQEIDRRTPKISGGGEITHLPAATWLTPRKLDPRLGSDPAPFCITVSQEPETQYQRPGGADQYYRPDATSEYARPPFTIGVCAGNVYSWAFYPDQNENAIPGGIVIAVTEATYENIDDDGDWGVWLECQLASKGTAYVPADSTDPDEEVFLMDSWVTTAIKLSGRDINALWTQSSHLANAIAASVGKSYVYIGRVQISSGEPTVTQAVNEDIFWIHPTFEDPA